MMLRAVRKQSRRMRNLHHIPLGSSLVSKAFSLLANLYGSKDRGTDRSTHGGVGHWQEHPWRRKCETQSLSFCFWGRWCLWGGRDRLSKRGRPHKQRLLQSTLLFLANISFPSTLTVAFLFNWIGFFLSFCLTTSAAGRYGAISGFGLSLIKWILIVRVSCIAENIDCEERQ